jgi:hypothetical protein
MNWNMRVRKVHRWLAIAFALAVIANIVALIKQEEATWLGLLAFLPMIPLMLTGLYPFVLPHASRWRAARRSPASATE